MFKVKKTEKSFLQGVLLAYLILFLHILLIMALGVLVIFFRGILYYMGWIVAGGLVAGVGLVYFVYMRMKHDKKTLKDMLNLPKLNGRPVEIGFLGGLATVKIGRPDIFLSGNADVSKKRLQIEDTMQISIEELADLWMLFEKGMITREEFNIAKNKLFKM
jgi:hypothetical protein